MTRLLKDWKKLPASGQEKYSARATGGESEHIASATSTKVVKIKQPKQSSRKGPKATAGAQKNKLKK